jgi:hypothetical protein
MLSLIVALPYIVVAATIVVLIHFLHRRFQPEKPLPPMKEVIAFATPMVFVMPLSALLMFGVAALAYLPLRWVLSTVSPAQVTALEKALNALPRWWPIAVTALTCLAMIAYWVHRYINEWTPDTLR